MYINKALLESSAIARHFMTDRERKVKKHLCQLLIDKGHRKYAERFWKLDFNIVDSKKHPEFTASISFDDATVYISDGFLGSGQGVFNQLDVLLRHELAHNLMMHQIRLMYVFKKQHTNDPDTAYEHIRYSASLHELLNWIEDFEISNKRYTSVDKKVVRAMQLNGKVISGLITEDHRSNWANMSLEAMYEALSNELVQINSEIRSNPMWLPTKDGSFFTDVDNLKVLGAGLIKKYSDSMTPSGIRVPIEVFIKTKIFDTYAPIYKKIVISLYDKLHELSSDADKQAILDIVKKISLTDPQEAFKIKHPNTNEIICTIYTPEDKALATEVLKNLGGNISYNAQKFKTKRKINSQEYKDAWNRVVQKLDTKQFDDNTLEQLQDAINNA